MNQAAIAAGQPPTPANGVDPLIGYGQIVFHVDVSIDVPVVYGGLIPLAGNLDSVRLQER